MRVFPGYLFVVLFLFGCGGGSDDSVSPPPVQPAPIEPNTFIIQGLAVDSSLFGGEVILKTDEGVVVASALISETGDYQIDFDLNNIDTNEAVLVEAVGKNPLIKLASMLGKVSDLVNYAGEDDLLDKSDYHPVVISSISTSIYALYSHQSLPFSGNFAENYEIPDIFSNDILPLATAIQFHISDLTEERVNSVFEDFSDTLALALSFEAAMRYTASIQSEDTYEIATNNIAENKNIFDSGFVPSEHYFTWSFTGAFTNGSGFVFEPNGSGVTLYGNEFNWSKDEGTISVDYIEPIQQRVQRYVDEVNDWVTYTEITYGFSTKRISRSNNRDLLMTSRFGKNEYSNVGLDDSEWQRDYIEFAIAKENGPQLSIIPDSNIYLPMFIEGRLHTDEFEFLDNGTGITLNSSRVFDWYQEDGKLFVTFDDSGVKWEWILLHSKQSKSIVMISEYSEEDDKCENVHCSIEMAAINPSVLDWEIDNLPGIYVFEPNSFHDINHRLWIELFENGEAQITFSSDFDAPIGLLTEHEVSPDYLGYWSTNDKQQLVVTAVEGGPDCRIKSFSNSCWLDHEYIFNLLGKSSNELLTLMNRRTYFGWEDDQYRDWISISNLSKVSSPPVILEKSNN